MTDLPAASGISSLPAVARRAVCSRLSEDPATRVLLGEAGPDLRAGAVPPVLASEFPGRAYFGAGWLWPDLRVSLGDDGSNRPAAPCL